MNHEPGLKRKLLRPRPRVDQDVALPPLARALPRAVMGAFSAGSGLSCQTGAVTLVQVSLDELGDRLPDDGFVALLTPAPRTATPNAIPGSGLIAMDGTLFATLIEAMTLGRLQSRVQQPRRATATDSALLGAAIDRLLRALDDPGTDQPTDPAAPPQPSGWRLARNVTDLRLLPALIDEGVHQMARIPVTLSCGDVTREGELQLLLPAPPAATSGTTRDRAAPAPADAGAAGDRLEGRVMAAPAQLNGVLGRVVLPLAEVMKLAPGHRFEFPLGQLEEVELTGLDGQTCAHARLGQWRGMRALRVVTLGESSCLAAVRALPDQPDAGAGFIAAHPLGLGTVD